MKRLAVHTAAEEVVAAYRDLRENPSLQAEQHLEGCISLLSLRLDVYERRERKQRGHAVSEPQVDELPVPPLAGKEEAVFSPQ